MKHFIYSLTILLLLCNGIVAQHIYTTQNGAISFFSEAPVADVDARNEKVKVELNTSTHELTINATMADFDFKNDKMGRDAYKKYLERGKHSKASFKRKVMTKIDFGKSEEYPATVSGMSVI